MAAPEGLVTLADLQTDPHPVLARLRAAGPAAWVPALGAWLVTGYDAAVAVLRDARPGLPQAARPAGAVGRAVSRASARRSAA